MMIQRKHITRTVVGLARVSWGRKVRIGGAAFILAFGISLPLLSMTPKKEVFNDTRYEVTGEIVAANENSITLQHPHRFRGGELVLAKFDITPETKLPGASLADIVNKTISIRVRAERGVRIAEQIRLIREQ